MDQRGAKDQGHESILAGADDSGMVGRGCQALFCPA